MRRLLLFLAFLAVLALVTALPDASPIDDIDAQADWKSTVSSESDSTLAEPAQSADSDRDTDSTDTQHSVSAGSPIVNLPYPVLSPSQLGLGVSHQQQLQQPVLSLPRSHLQQRIVHLPYPVLSPAHLGLGGIQQQQSLQWPIGHQAQQPQPYQQPIVMVERTWRQQQQQQQPAISLGMPTWQQQQLQSPWQQPVQTPIASTWQQQQQPVQQHPIVNPAQQAIGTSMPMPMPQQAQFPTRQQPLIIPAQQQAEQQQQPIGVGVPQQQQPAQPAMEQTQPTNPMPQQQEVQPNQQPQMQQPQQQEQSLPLPQQQQPLQPQPQHQTSWPLPVIMPSQPEQQQNPQQQPQQQPTVIPQPEQQQQPESVRVSIGQPQEQAQPQQQEQQQQQPAQPTQLSQPEQPQQQQQQPSEQQQQERPQPQQQEQQQPAQQQQPSQPQQEHVQQPILGAPSESQPQPPAGASSLCPLIKYDVSLTPISPSQLSQMQLGATHAAESASPDAHPVLITFIAKSFVANESLPSVEWVDVHWKVSTTPQQLQVGVTEQAASPSPQHNARMQVSVSGAGQPQHFSHGPVFLNPSDVLSVSFTYCANMVDCDTETQVFGLPKLGAAQPKGLCPAIEYKSEVSCSAAGCQLSFINLDPKPLDWVDVHVKSAASVLLQSVGISSTTPNQAESQVNFRMQLAAGPMGKMHMMGGNMPMKMGEEQQQQQPMQPEQQQQPQQQGQPEQQQQPESQASKQLLSQSGGSQVWQFQLPLAFSAGDTMQVSFTYCQDGVDCDTEWEAVKIGQDLKAVKMQMRAEKPQQQQQQQQPQQPSELQQPMQLAQPQQPQQQQQQPSEFQQPMQPSEQLQQPLQPSEQLQQPLQPQQSQPQAPMQLPHSSWWQARPRLGMGWMQTGQQQQQPLQQQQLQPMQQQQQQPAELLQQPLPSIQPQQLHPSRFRLGLGFVPSYQRAQTQQQFEQLQQGRMTQTWASAERLQQPIF